MRIKKFAWFPTEVYSSPFYRDGFRWFSFIYMDGGKAYTHQDGEA